VTLPASETVNIPGLVWSHPSQEAALKQHPEWINPPVRYAPAPGRLVFQRFDVVVGSLQIYSMADDGTDVKNLSNNPVYYDSCPAWSSDHSRIVFARSSASSGPSALWVMQADGSQQQRLTQPAAGVWDSEPAWGTNNWIAFTRSYAIWVVAADGSGAQPLGGSGNDPHAIEHMPTWSPDCTEIACCHESYTGGIIGARTFGAPGPLRAITVPNSSRFDAWPAWAPDGTQLAFSRNENGASAIWVIGANGELATEHNLSQGAADQAPSWSPQGDAIAFDRPLRPGPHIWRLDLFGSSRDLSAVTPETNQIDALPNWA
jgi:Tol biopolymer transport system component